MNFLTITMCVLWGLPGLIAFCRNVRARTMFGIALVTITLSWTIIGWIAALLWALEAPRDDR